MSAGYVLIPSTTLQSATNGYIKQAGNATKNGKYILAGSNVLTTCYNFMTKPGDTIYNVVLMLGTNGGHVFTTASGDDSAYSYLTNLNVSGAYLDNRYKMYASVDDGFASISLNNYEPYNTIDDALLDILSETYSKINYIANAVAIAGPRLVADGSLVTAYVTSPNGVIVTDSDITITKNGNSVPFTYSNGILTFTA